MSTMSVSTVERTDEYSRDIVYGYIHDIEKLIELHHSIPNAVKNICLSFYRRSFINLNCNFIKPTPFALIFAIYNKEFTSNITDWDSSKQCEYLQMNDDTEYEELNLFPNVLSMYHQHSKSLLSQQNINAWDDCDIIVSFMYYLINADNATKWKNKQKVWEFTNYFRKYCYDINYDGKQLLESIIECKQPSNKGYGLQTMKSLCSKYALKSGPFSIMKKHLNRWSNQYNISSTSSTTSIESVESGEELSSPTISMNQKSTNRITMILDNSMVKKIVYGFVFDSCKHYQFYHQMPVNVHDTLVLFYHKTSVNVDTMKQGPFTILFGIYNLESTMKVKGWNLCPVDKQCKYLDLNRISSDVGRNKLLKNLMENEYNFQDIIIKSDIFREIGDMLAVYYQGIQKLLTSKQLIAWNVDDIIISIISHLIIETNKINELKNCNKIWEFVGYLRRYLIDTKYDGKVLWESIIDCKPKYSNIIRRYALKTISYVCWRYQLPLLKHRKLDAFLNSWALNVYNQYHITMDNESNKSFNTGMITGQQFIYQTDNKQTFSNKLLIHGFTRKEEVYLSESKHIPDDIKQVIEQFYGKTYRVAGKPPSDTEFDYAVEILIPMKMIGIEYNETKILKCTSDFAQKNIIPSSDIIQMNDNYVKDKNLKTTEIQKIMDYVKKNGKSYIILRASKQLNQSGTHFLFDITSTTTTNRFPFHKCEPPKLLNIFKQIFIKYNQDILSVMANRACLSGGKGVSLSIFIDGNAECDKYKMMKLNYLIQRELGRDAVISLSYTMNGLKGYGIDTVWSEIPQSYWKTNTMKLGGLIYKVKGVDNDKEAWYYILVEQDKLEEFNIALTNDIIHLEQYGEILYSAYGSEPPQEITDKLKQIWLIQD